ncbi:hypothetical protein Agub_g10635, partial [Astrephomene gubernaculifera]
MASTLALFPQPGAFYLTRQAQPQRLTIYWPSGAPPRRPYQRCPAAEPLPAARTIACRSAAHLAQLVAYVAPVCFNQACQEASDRAFLITLSIPLLVAAIAAVTCLRPPP